MSPCIFLLHFNPTSIKLQNSKLSKEIKTDEDCWCCCCSDDASNYDNTNRTVHKIAHWSHQFPCPCKLQSLSERIDIHKSQCKVRWMKHQKIFEFRMIFVLEKIIRFDYKTIDGNQSVKLNMLCYK